MNKYNASIEIYWEEEAETLEEAREKAENWQQEAAGSNDGSAISLMRASW